MEMFLNGIVVIAQLYKFTKTIESYTYIQWIL